MAGTDGALLQARPGEKCDLGPGDAEEDRGGPAVVQGRPQAEHGHSPGRVR